MKKKYLFIFLMPLFSKCSEPKYLIKFQETKKAYSFSRNDTIIIKGGVLPFKGNKFFLGYHNSEKAKFIKLGNANDSFLHIINTFAYYMGKEKINTGTGIQNIPEKKREYVKIENDIYKVLSIDMLTAVLQKIKKSINTSDAFEPLFRIPDLQYKSMSEDSVNLKDFQGKNKLILVTVWATWCPSCIDNLPTLNNLALQLKDKLLVISLNYKEDYRHFEKYVTNPNIIYGRIGQREYKKLNTGGLPYYALFNDKGELVNYHYSIKDCKWITSHFK